MKKVIGVNFINSTKIYYFLPNDLKVNRDSFVIVDTEKGEQFGKVVTDLIEVDEKKLDFELKKVIRVASKKDTSINDKNLNDAKKALKDAKNIALELELRQIGVRDKAKVVGGYGQCGKELCCSKFLRDLNSVSINQAKNQNLALNPQKINGVCGRLMCCLSFENDNYTIYKKGLPKVGDKIVSNGETGKVISVDIFARTCKLETEDSKIIIVEYKE